MVVNKLVIIVILALICMPFVMADASYTFQYGKGGTFSIPLSESDQMPLQNCAANITLTSPVDGTVLINNNATSCGNGYATFILPANKTNILGAAGGDLAFTNGSAYGRTTFTYEITGDGYPYKLFPVQLVILIIGYLMLFVGFITNKIKLINYIASVIIIIMGVLTLYPGYSYINYSNLFGQTLGITSIGLGFFFLLYDYFSEGEQNEYYTSE